MYLQVDTSRGVTLLPLNQEKRQRDGSKHIDTVSKTGQEFERVPFWWIPKYKASAEHVLGVEWDS